MSKKKHKEPLLKNDGPWQRVSGRYKNGKLDVDRFEKFFPDRRAVDLAVDLLDPLSLRNLALWLPVLEAERKDWATRKLHYVERALARPTTPYSRQAIREAVHRASAEATSPALQRLALRLSDRVAIASGELALAR